jgi:hypothetical protein
MTAPRTWTFLLALCAPPLTFAAEGCEGLLAEIDAKIRANGQTRFTLQAVDAAAEPGGRVVGSCAMGRQKIVYLPEAGGGGGGGSMGVATPRVRTPAPPGATLAHPGGQRRASAGVLTECRPGYTGPDCSERLVVPAVAPAASRPQ